jgi:hypothetical protein
MVGVPCLCAYGKPADAARAVEAFKLAAAAAGAPGAPVALLLPLRGAMQSAAAGVNLTEATDVYRCVSDAVMRRLRSHPVRYSL